MPWSVVARKKRRSKPARPQIRVTNSFGGLNSNERLPWSSAAPGLERLPGTPLSPKRNALVQIVSASFADGAAFDARHTREGADISLALSSNCMPAGTKSLARSVADPAAPKMTWVHWVLHDIPAAATGLPEGIAPAALPPGTVGGLNDWKRSGYGGPCPPIGRHRYFQKLYALDARLAVRGPLANAELEAAMRGHILAAAELMERYQKRR
ncbi:MAG: YbhB/YbcL family Raf kinase inhibitor-like protein [Rhodocyclaceae bacterium]|nr:YbhB/YbcL family Raf kinase inhibitor-like protein [Rhodocyclaceae bacterium]